MVIGVLDNSIAPGDRVIPWLSECSNQWRFKPLKYFCAVNRLALPETTELEYEFLYIDINSVNSEGYWTPSESIIFSDAPSRARRIVQDGDVIVSTVRTYLKAISFIEKVNGNLICSTGFAVLAPGASVYPKFLFYWARSEWFVNEIVARSVGVSYPAINAIEIGNLPFPMISTEEQQIIADFLDRETRKIDELIARKQKLIELLQEQRTALITHTITKGLNPDAPMKGSGIEWLGEIPAHWEMKRLRFLSKINPSKTETRNLSPDLEVTFLPMENVGCGDLNIEQTRELSSVSEGYTYFRDGDVLVAKITPCFENGKGAISEGLLNGIGFGTTELHIIRPTPDLDRRFLMYITISHAFRYIGESEMYGAAGQKRVSDKYIRDFTCPYPAPQEQQVIVDYLDQETFRIDSLVSRINQAIEKLQEYRSALITAAVTGKIDVRKEAT